MTNWHGNGGGWGGDAPVFSWDWPHVSDEDETPDKSYGLPLVWVSEQTSEPTDEATGRDCFWRYNPADDPEGDAALAFGARYYSEGMSCDPETEHEKRVMCFQAAELLYLHAAKKGHPYGDLDLGYVYSYDRCEGVYWAQNQVIEAPGAVQMLEWDTVEAVPFDRDAAAYRHFREAAEAEIPEACYKLGDLLRDGRGCEADEREAFYWFERAYELGKHDAPVFWGSAALRLGTALEEGRGCEQSFAEACVWYERATTGLGIAVRGGEQWYRGALRHAERGLKRVRQELSGEY